MYAIVDIAGQQFKVTKDQKLFVHRLEGKEGSKVTFEKVYLIDNDKNVTVGEPVIKGASVSATILNHAKGDKVLVFKKKRRKGYQKLTGHRQYLTHIQIDNIAEKSVKPAAESKAEVRSEEPVKKAGSVKETKPETTKGPAEKKSSPAKKSAAPKTTPKKPAATEKKATAATKKGAGKAEPKTVKKGEKPKKSPEKE
ncbi:MAG: 50S ribosomal protein L21 [Bacteroidales bacterium]|nr:50S ribosomal protein L21 [Bacteroidales bacterium]